MGVFKLVSFDGGGMSPKEYYAKIDEKYRSRATSCYVASSLYLILFCVSCYEYFRRFTTEYRIRRREESRYIRFYFE
jgi:hypothetical protein